jgi:peroxiredoxin
MAKAEHYYYDSDIPRGGPLLDSSFKRISLAADWLQRTLNGNTFRGRRKPKAEARFMKWRSLQEFAESPDLRPLREILAERQDAVAKYVPAETQAVHARAITKLKERNLAAQILPVSARIPDFRLNDQDGNSISSASLLTNRLVLCFIRGRWCPFCVAQMEAMNLVSPEIEQAGATLVAISPQTVQQSFFMRNQHKLRFPLLSDAGNKVARLFGLTYRVPDEQKTVYQRAFVNLPFVNGDDSWELPIPAIYIIDRDSTVLYASANEDYTERPEPREIVAFLTATLRG